MVFTIPTVMHVVMHARQRRYDDSTDVKHHTLKPFDEKG